ncbi:MAG: Transcriptional regulator [Candidatus Methanohalarchaeum thermophilum]|uniref:Transcriptional regulator n=1 Tax=Methanohalarchaeum thermophilum TaxID=1903181 RepID=A0A1Q6DWE0_METT1|nr:MAG: Transcriptional regulator [Candidatus Methanohalarchaeum thermophilum]
MVLGVKLFILLGCYYFLVMVDSFLTGRQKKVLKLRDEGKTQEEVSEILGTSRSNVSLIEKRARKNILKSKETLKEWKSISAPVEVGVEEDTDILDVPERVYEKANIEDIKVDLATIELIEEIEEKANDFLDHRMVKKSFRIYVTKDGEIIIERNDSI